VTRYNVVSFAANGRPMVVEFPNGYRAGLGQGCLMIWKGNRGYEVCRSRKTAGEWYKRGLSDREIKACYERALQVAEEGTLA
jgi:hypothetical protein